jgi:hypothetical protein
MTEPTRKRGRPKGAGSVNKSHLPEMARLIKYDTDIGAYKAARKVLGPSAEKNRIDSLARCWKNYQQQYLKAEKDRPYRSSYLSLIAVSKNFLNFPDTNPAMVRLQNQINLLNTINYPEVPAFERLQILNKVSTPNIQNLINRHIEFDAIMKSARKIFPHLNAL